MKENQLPKTYLFNLATQALISLIPQSALKVEQKQKSINPAPGGIGRLGLKKINMEI